jgi:hypothetical protein
VFLRGSGALGREESRTLQSLRTSADASSIRRRGDTAARGEAAYSGAAPGGAPLRSTEPGADQREPSDSACAPGALTAALACGERRSAVQEPRHASRQCPALHRRGSAAGAGLRPPPK